jgi:hypothetical protein
VRARGPTAVAQAFAKGFREGDAGTLEALSVPDLQLTVRASGEDLRLEGARAIAELVALARSRFGERPFSERWLAVARRAKAMVAFVGSAPDGSRLDLLLTLLIRRRRVARVLLIAVGDREGGIGSPAGAADDSSREVAWSSARSSTGRGAAG